MDMRERVSRIYPGLQYYEKDLAVGIRRYGEYVISEGVRLVIFGTPEDEVRKVYAQMSYQEKGRKGFWMNKVVAEFTTLSGVREFVGVYGFDLPDDRIGFLRNFLAP
jgi:hypothetical protein